MRRGKFFKSSCDNNDTILDIDSNEEDSSCIYYVAPTKKDKYNYYKKEEKKEEEKKEEEKKEEEKKEEKKEEKIIKNIEENIEEKVKKIEKKSEEITRMNKKGNYEEEELLFNLKIISELKISDKLSCSTKKFRIDDPSYTQGLYRWLGGEDRAKTLEKLNEIIDATFNYIDRTFTSEIESDIMLSKSGKDVLYENNSQILQKFYIALLDTTKGLDRLKSTYASDKSMTTGINLLSDKIKTRTDKIKELLKISL